VKKGPPRAGRDVGAAGATAFKAVAARDIMSGAVLMVRDDMTVDELAEYLVENQISGAPVVDRRGRPVGVVSLTDIAEARIEARALAADRPRADAAVHGWEAKIEAEEMRRFHIAEGAVHVRDIMTPTIYSVADDTPACDVARTMLSGRIHRLLVTRQGKIVGIVTSMDLLKLLCEE
jgi:CBS domain-containing protein